MDLKFPLNSHCRFTEVFPDVQSKPLVFQFVPGHHWKHPGSTSFVSSLQVFIPIVEVPVPIKTISKEVGFLRENNFAYEFEQSWFCMNPGSTCICRMCHWCLTSTLVIWSHLKTCLSITKELFAAWTAGLAGTCTV